MPSFSILNTLSLLTKAKTISSITIMSSKLKKGIENPWFFKKVSWLPILPMKCRIISNDTPCLFSFLSKNFVSGIIDDALISASMLPCACVCDFLFAVLDV